MDPPSFWINTFDGDDFRPRKPRRLPDVAPEREPAELDGWQAPEPVRTWWSATPIEHCGRRYVITHPITTDPRCPECGYRFMFIKPWWRGRRRPPGDATRWGVRLPPSGRA